MPCYKPLVAFHNATSGAVYFHEKQRHGETRQILLPCGQCLGCKLQRANDWATRCQHEASLHEYNIFGTFTYSPEKLQTQSLCHRDWQLFAKRLRKALGSKKYANTIAISESLYYTADMGFHPIPRMKYYMAGEYGSQTRRPHFHACLFGIDLLDKKYYSTNKHGNNTYTSATLDDLWQNGQCLIGEVSYESAAYIARYIIDKKTGDNAGKYYEHIDEETGEITDLRPEYNKMSLAEGIGKNWLRKYTPDVYPHGHVITRGKKNKAPKYYDKIYKKEEPEQYAELKTQREYAAAQQAQDNTDARLEAKQTVKQAQLSQLKRTI